MSIDRVTNIEQQLAHMRWRRMQNERAIRHNMVTTRKMQTMDLVIIAAANSAQERNEWITHVIKDELQRPLVLNDKDVVHLKEYDVQKKDKLIKCSERQIKTIEKLSRVAKARIEIGEGGKEIQLATLANLNLLKQKVTANKKKLSAESSVFKTRFKD